MQDRKEPSLEGATCSASGGKWVEAPYPALAKVGKTARISCLPGVFIELRKNSKVEDIPASIGPVRPGP